MGGELQFTQYPEPLITYLVSRTPTARYTFLISDTVRPNVEAGAGLVGTDLGDRITKKGAQFSFNPQVGDGLSYVVTPTTSVKLTELPLSAHFQRRHSRAEPWDRRRGSHDRHLEVFLNGGPDSKNLFICGSRIARRFLLRLSELRIPIHLASFYRCPGCQFRSLDMTPCMAVYLPVIQS